MNYPKENQSLKTISRSFSTVCVFARKTISVSHADALRARSRQLSCSLHWGVIVKSKNLLTTSFRSLLLGAAGFLAMAASTLGYAAGWCDHLTTVEVAAVVGKPVLATTEVPMGKDQGACSYFTDAKKTIPVASTQIHMNKGKFYYSLYCETDKGGAVKGTPVKDLGDQACFKSNSVITVRKGERLILISVAVMGAKPEQLVPLGKAALARM
jgi:hypothetical protein